MPAGQAPTPSHPPLTAGGSPGPPLSHCLQTQASNFILFSCLCPLTNTKIICYLSLKSRPESLFSVGLWAEARLSQPPHLGTRRALVLLQWAHVPTGHSSTSTHLPGHMRPSPHVRHVLSPGMHVSSPNIRHIHSWQSCGSQPESGAWRPLHFGSDCDPLMTCECWWSTEEASRTLGCFSPSSEGDRSRHAGFPVRSHPSHKDGGGGSGSLSVFHGVLCGLTRYYLTQVSVRTLSRKY